MATLSNFPSVFLRLRTILLESSPGGFVGKDDPTDFRLYTVETTDPKSGEWLGAVQIKKNYVSYHLISVYFYPDLLAGMSDGLKKRMQGKGCFNFKAEDEILFAELAILTRRSWEKFQAEGWPRRTG